MAEGRSPYSFSKVLLFGFVLMAVFNSVVIFWKKEGDCLSHGVEDELQKFEHVRELILISMASKLQGIHDNVIEITNEDPVSFTLSSKGVVAALITILVIAFQYIFSKHYKKPCRDSMKVETYASPSGMKNISGMPRREGTASPSLPPSLPGMKIPLKAIWQWEWTQMQSYKYPTAIRTLPTPVLNNAENRSTTCKVQQLPEYRGLGRRAVLLKLKRKNEDMWERRLASGLPLLR